MAPKLTHAQVARMCHELNRAYCQAIGDDSQVPWDDAPEWQRASCIDGVGFLVKNEYANVGNQHDNWVAEKERNGWKAGPVKDAEKKEHPCMVPFEDLPLEQQTKDRLFKWVVNGLCLQGAVGNQ